MGKSQFIKDFFEGQRISDVFLLTQKQMCVGKNQSNYLTLKLSDKTGEIDGKKWETNESEYEKLAEGRFYEIKGLITVYQGIKQFRIDSIALAGKSYEIADFMKSSPRDLEEMKKELKEFIGSVKADECKKLLNYFFNNPSFYKKFTESPAAKFLHHDYVNGLLEHTLETVKIADYLSKIYADFVKRDILITGALLHDIGKIKEYEIKAGIDITDDGIFLGHLVIGAMMIEKASENLKLDNTFSSHIEHMIISHHGKYEWGSAKRPKSLEAILLHYADDISFNVASFVKYVSAEIDSEESFTKNNKTHFERRLFKGYLLDYLKNESDEEMTFDNFDDFLAAFK